jgi:ABC-type transporter Mla maintaining outer membrane lipid asymmetry ATPase subunit MlaF
MDSISKIDSITEEYGVDQAATGSAQPEPVVSVRGLVKRYGSHEAVAGIDLEVRRGEIFAFIAALALFTGAGAALYLVAWLLIPAEGHDQSIAAAWIASRNREGESR